MLRTSALPFHNDLFSNAKDYLRKDYATQNEYWATIISYQEPLVILPLFFLMTNFYIGGKKNHFLVLEMSQSCSVSS